MCTSLMRIHQDGFPIRARQFKSDFIFSFQDTHSVSFLPHQLCMLDLLDSLPCLRLSDAQMKAIMFVMCKCGVTDVPSLSTLRQTQIRLCKAHAVPVKLCTSGRGNIFYTYDIAGQILKVNHHCFNRCWTDAIPASFDSNQDFANPLLRPHLRLYPEAINREMYEAWNGHKRCFKLDNNVLTPMAIGVDNQHFHVQEMARCRSGQFIIPQRWNYLNGALCTFSLLVDKAVSPLYGMIANLLKYYKSGW